MAPGFSEAFDLFNAGISLARGRPGDAALRTLAAAPFIGWGATGAKLGSKAFKGGDELIRIRTYTNNLGREGISKSGYLRKDTWVTLPNQLPSKAGHRQIEKILEIQPGRGSNYIDIDVPSSNLRIPKSGAKTSGGALQYQLNSKVQVDPNKFRNPPGRP